MTKGKNFLKVEIATLFIGLLAFVSIGCSKSEPVVLKIVDFAWERSVQIEELKVVTEEGWKPPVGAKILGSHQKIKDYRDEVVGHKWVMESIKYKDASMREECAKFPNKPICNEDQELRRVKKEIVEQIPVRATWYMFEVEKWENTRRPSVSGHDRNPYWPETSLRAKERESGRNERYTIKFRDEKGKYFEVSYPELEWKSFDPEVKYVGQVGFLGNLDKVRKLTAEATQ